MQETRVKKWIHLNFSLLAGWLPASQAVTAHGAIFDKKGYAHVDMFGGVYPAEKDGLEVGNRVSNWCQNFYKDLQASIMDSLTDDEVSQTLALVGGLPVTHFSGGNVNSRAVTQRLSALLSLVIILYPDAAFAFSSVPFSSFFNKQPPPRHDVTFKNVPFFGLENSQNSSFSEKSLHVLAMAISYLHPKMCVTPEQVANLLRNPGLADSSQARSEIMKMYLQNQVEILHGNYPVADIEKVLNSGGIVLASGGITMRRAVLILAKRKLSNTQILKAREGGTFDEVMSIKTSAYDPPVQDYYLLRDPDSQVPNKWVEQSFFEREMVNGGTIDAAVAILNKPLAQAPQAPVYQTPQAPVAQAPSTNSSLQMAYIKPSVQGTTAAPVYGAPWDPTRSGPGQPLGALPDDTVISYTTTQTGQLQIHHVTLPNEWISWDGYEVWVPKEAITTFPWKLAYTNRQTPLFGKAGGGNPLREPLQPGTFVKVSQGTNENGGWFRVSAVATPKPVPSAGFIDITYTNLAIKPSPSTSPATPNGSFPPPPPPSSASPDILPVPFPPSPSQYETAPSSDQSAAPVDPGAQANGFPRPSQPKSPKTQAPSQAAIPDGYKTAPPFKRFVRIEEWVRGDLREEVEKKNGFDMPAPGTFDIRYIQLHHTTTPTYTQEQYDTLKGTQKGFDWCVEKLNEMLRGHLGRNFDSIGYNFIYCPLAPDVLFGGRDKFGQTPAGILNLNTNGIALNIMGQYENKPEAAAEANGIINKVTPQIADALKKTIIWIAHEHQIPIGIDPRTNEPYKTQVVRKKEGGVKDTIILETTIGHGEGGGYTNNTTNCPGNQLKKVIEEEIRQVTFANQPTRKGLAVSYFTPGIVMEDPNGTVEDF